MIRPGPDAIEPGAYPGGIMVHLYDGDGELLGAEGVGDGTPRAELAEVDGTGPLCLVVYDGDTGLRFTPADLAAAGLTAGERIR